MLILRRKEGQWVEITHRSGDVLRVRVYNVRSHYPGQADLAFDDDARNFLIQRPERKDRPALAEGESLTASLVAGYAAAPPLSSHAVAALTRHMDEARSAAALSPSALAALTVDLPSAGANVTGPPLYSVQPPGWLD